MQANSPYHSLHVFALSLIISRWHKPPYAPTNNLPVYYRSPILLAALPELQRWNVKCFLITCLCERHRPVERRLPNSTASFGGSGGASVAVVSLGGGGASRWQWWSLAGWWEPCGLTRGWRSLKVQGEPPWGGFLKVALRVLPGIKPAPDHQLTRESVVDLHLFLIVLTETGQTAVRSCLKVAKYYTTFANSV